MYDSSYLDSGKMARHWYNRTISEFPRSEAAELAYVKAFKTLIGKSGTYGKEGYGFMGGLWTGERVDQKAARHFLSRMVQCFEEYARDFPKGGYLNRMRFQIGQAYWAVDDMQKASDWLNQVVVSGHDSELLTYFARERLKALKKP